MNVIPSAPRQAPLPMSWQFPESLILDASGMPNSLAKTEVKNNPPVPAQQKIMYWGFIGQISGQLYAVVLWQTQKILHDCAVNPAAYCRT